MCAPFLVSFCLGAVGRCPRKPGGDYSTSSFSEGLSFELSSDWGPSLLSWAYHSSVSRVGKDKWVAQKPSSSIANEFINKECLSAPCEQCCPPPPVFLSWLPLVTFLSLGYLVGLSYETRLIMSRVPRMPAIHLAFPRQEAVPVRCICPPCPREAPSSRL